MTERKRTRKAKAEQAEQISQHDFEVECVNRINRIRISFYELFEQLNIDRPNAFTVQLLTRYALEFNYELVSRWVQFAAITVESKSWIDVIKYVSGIRRKVFIALDQNYNFFNGGMNNGN